MAASASRLTLFAVTTAALLSPSTAAYAYSTGATLSAADQAYSFTYCHGGTGATTIAELLRDADVLVAVKTYHSFNSFANANNATTYGGKVRFAVFLQSKTDCADWVDDSANMVVFSDTSDLKFSAWFGMARPQHYVIDKRGTFTYVDPDNSDCGQCGSWDDDVYAARIEEALSSSSAAAATTTQPGEQSTPNTQSSAPRAASPPPTNVVPPSSSASGRVSGLTTTTTALQLVAALSAGYFFG